MAKLDSINLCKLYDDFPASTLLPAAAVLRYFSICYGILCLITRLGKKEEGWAPKVQTVSRLFCSTSNSILENLKFSEKIFKVKFIIMRQAYLVARLRGRPILKLVFQYSWT
jgi:hypothetical protein